MPFSTRKERVVEESDGERKIEREREIGGRG